MENTTSSDASATQTPETPATGNTASAGATPPKPALTLEEALKKIADLEHSHTNAKEELTRHRSKLSAYEKAEKEAEAAKKAAEEAQLSEIERVNNRYAELQAQYDSLVREAQEQRVRGTIERAAASLRIVDPEAAVRLIDWAELEFDDNGTPTNVDTLLEALIKKKTYLAPQDAGQSQPSTNAAPATAQAMRPATPAIPAMNPGRSTIPAPGSRLPGKIPRLSDPGVLVPPGTISKYQP